MPRLLQNLADSRPVDCRTHHAPSADPGWMRGAGAGAGGVPAANVSQAIRRGRGPPAASRPAGPRPPDRLAYSRKVEISEIDPGPSWAPQACTLPTAGRPLRAAEFARLLASVQHIERRQPTWLHLDLDPSPRTAGQAAELAMA